MKALNRAISRTVSQINRITTPDEYYPPLLDKLRQHLDDLLAMERKQLEVDGMKFATLTGDGMGQAIPGVLVHGGGVRACPGTAYVVGGMGGSSAGNSGARAGGSRSTIAFSTPQEKNGSLLDSFIANGMMEQDGFREQPAKMSVQEWAQKAMTIAPRDAGAASEQPEPPQPSLQWKVGDFLERVSAGNKQWTVGKLYEIQTIDAGGFQLVGDDGLPYWTRQENNAFVHRGKVVPPAPDVIDMTNPRNWQVGDVLMCSDGNAFLGINAGDECAVVENNETYVVVRRNSGTAVALHHDKPTESAFFTWLRHGEAQQ